MKSAKPLLIVSSILGIIGSSINTILFGIVSSISNNLQPLMLIPLVLLILSIMQLIYSSKLNEEIKEKYNFFLILGIIYLFINLISGILNLVACNDIKNDKDDNEKKDEINDQSNLSKSPSTAITKKENISSDSRKIDILLKIGTFLVILSGIIFATSSWNLINNFTKSSFLLIISILFFALSYFFNKKIPIHSSEITYDILGKVFIIFYIISIGYFKVLGNYFSFTGDGKDLLFSLIFATLAIIIYLSIEKYKISIGYELTIILGLISLYYLLNQIIISNALIVLIFSLISLGIYYYKGDYKKNLTNINYILMPILLIFSVVDFSLLINNFKMNDVIAIKDIDFYLDILSSLLLLFNLYLHSSFNKQNKLTKSNIWDFLLPIMIVSYVLLITSCITKQDIILKLFAITLLLNLSIFMVKNKIYELCCFYLTNFFLILYLILFNINDYQPLPIIICSIIYLILLLYYVFKADNKVEQTVAFFIQYLPVSFAISSLCTYCESSCPMITNYSGQLIILSWGLMTLLETNFLEDKKYYNFLNYFILILAVIINFDCNVSSIFSIFYAILFGFFAYFSEKFTDSKYDYALTSIAMVNVIISIYKLLIYNNLILIGTMALIAILITLLIIFRNKEKMVGITALFIFQSYFYLVHYLSIDYLSSDLTIILVSLGIILLIFILTKIIYHMNKKMSFIFELILLPWAFLFFIFTADVPLGIYIGIVSIIMMIIGYTFKDYLSLFWIGIVILFLNIIIQMQDLWLKIPLFIYLLIAGLFLIFFVTYKQIKKEKPKESKKMKSLKEEKDYITDKDHPLNWICVSIIIILLILSFILFIDIPNKQESKEVLVSETNNINIFSKSEYDSSKIYYDKNDNVLYINNDYKYDIKSIYHYMEGKGIYQTEIAVSKVNSKCNLSKGEVSKCSILSVYPYEAYQSSYQFINNVELYFDRSTYIYRKEVDYNKIFVAYDSALNSKVTLYANYKYSEVNTATNDEVISIYDINNNLIDTIDNSKTNNGYFDISLPDGKGYIMVNNQTEPSPTTPEIN